MSSGSISIMQYVSAAKEINNIGNDHTTFTYDMTFDIFDFRSSTAHSYIEGPLSISFDVSHTVQSPLYIGMDIHLDTGVITISDRWAIGFIEANGARTIGPASVPQLAYIEGRIKKIVLHFYRLDDRVVQLSRIRCYLRIEDPKPISAPQPLIGRDRVAVETGIYDNTAAIDIAVVAGANSVTIATSDALKTGMRMRIPVVNVVLPPTTYPGDIFVELRSTRLGVVSIGMCRFYSMTDRFVCEVVYPNIVLAGVDTFFITAWNNHAVNTYNVSAFIYEEIIY
jgi:hypothetical protein